MKDWLKQTSAVAVGVLSAMFIAGVIALVLFASALSNVVEDEPIGEPGPSFTTDGSAVDPEITDP
jgi:hypothetical protein